MLGSKLCMMFFCGSYAVFLKASSLLGFLFDKTVYWKWMKKLWGGNRFAGEIFCELHEQLTALRRRGNGLKSRLLKLETEVPVIEKELRNSTDQFSYNYIAGK